jgi:hypothetical protein
LGGLLVDARVSDPVNLEREVRILFNEALEQLKIDLGSERPQLTYAHTFKGSYTTGEEREPPYSLLMVRLIAVIPSVTPDKEDRAHRFALHVHSCPSAKLTGRRYWRM